MSSLLKVQRVRDAVTKTTKLLSHAHVEVRQRGAQPHVMYGEDGKVEYINLPVIPDDPSQEFLDAIQGFVDHEVAHVLFTDNRAERRIILAHTDDPALITRLKMFTNIFEDVRIEAAMRREFVGSGHNLTNALTFMLSEVIGKRFAEAEKVIGPDRPAMRAQAAFVPFIRSLAGEVVADEWLDEKNVKPDLSPILKSMPSLPDRLAAMRSTNDAAQLAIDFLDAITPPPPPPPPEMPSLGEADEGTSEDKPEKSEKEEKAKPEPKPDADEADEPDTEGSDEEDDDGEGAGGSPDESDSDTHAPDDEADPDGDDSDDDGGDEDGADDEPGEDDWTDGDDSGGDDKGKESLTFTEAMKRLDPNQRKLLSEYGHKKKTVEQIASETGSTADAVARDLSAARGRLVDILEGGR